MHVCIVYRYKNIRKEQKTLSLSLSGVLSLETHLCVVNGNSFSIHFIFFPVRFTEF